MKKSTLLFVFLNLVLGVSSLSFAQNVYDLNGSFEGRLEISDSIDNTFETFLYMYDLTQDGSNITGTSIVYDNQGDYDEVLIHGVIVGDKLYFEEYGTTDEIDRINDDWCYESGHLDIELKDGKTILSGKIKSFSKSYGIFCTESYAQLERPDKDVVPMMSDSDEGAPKVGEIFVSPNPMENISSISFAIYESQFSAIVVKNLNGEILINPLQRNLIPGKYNIELDLSMQEMGMYILNLMVGDQIFSTELYKLKM